MRLLLAALLFAVNPELLHSRWTAQWITVPDAPPFDYGVYHFRKWFDLAAKPEHFVIHVSADNRYQLFVNGRRSVNGPARGDLYHWRYETVDIAPLLNAGRNTIAAVVWNYGQYAPEAQQTWQTGFLVQGDTEPERIVDTGDSWRCIRDEAYSPLPVTWETVPGYFVAGPGEHVDAAKYPWGWEQPSFDDSQWLSARTLSNAAARDSSDSPNRWMLVSRTVPQMEETPQRIVDVRETSGPAAPSGWPAEAHAFTIPAHTHARYLLDQTFLTTGHPVLRVSGGRSAEVTLAYAEALADPNDKSRLLKGNRNEVAGKKLYGYQDVFVADGGRERVFTSLWWRTWRYIELTVDTADEPLSIDDLSAIFSAYPLERRAQFDAGDAELTRILDTGWRTARLCAHETYMDCPYYEQLQYVGDTRVQAMVSLYMSGDDQLMRNAIAQINDSRTAEGATYSRAPSRLQQYIPTFSLWWIGMVHDYWMYRDDPEFVRSMLPGVRQVLSFFERYQRPDGSLAGVPWWNFVDWVPAWRDGIPPLGPDGSSSIFDLQLLLAYQWAAELENSADDRSRAEALSKTIEAKYWDADRGLYADNSAKNTFSQHANALAIIAGIAGRHDAAAVMRRTLDDHSLAQATFYFRFYVNAAMNRTGEGDRYVPSLDPWRNMLRLGLTTWAENPEPTRSDCHAWSASPNVELFRTVLGVDSAARGFRVVSVRPFLGPLQKVSGAVPHPHGTIRVSLARSGATGIRGEVELPPDTTGWFEWHGSRAALRPGRNIIAAQ